MRPAGVLSGNLYTFDSKFLQLAEMKSQLMTLSAIPPTFTVLNRRIIHRPIRPPSCPTSSHSRFYFSSHAMQARSALIHLLFPLTRYLSHSNKRSSCALQLHLYTSTLSTLLLSTHGQHNPYLSLVARVALRGVHARNTTATEYGDRLCALHMGCTITTAVQAVANAWVPQAVNSSRSHMRTLHEGHKPSASPGTTVKPVTTVT